jgi:predicted transcriptional regulator
MRKQFVLDKRTIRLEELASYRGGNRSLVIREAIQVYADTEDRLDTIEADPAFQAMMAKSHADIRDGRVIPHNEALRMGLVYQRVVDRGVYIRGLWPARIP